MSTSTERGSSNHENTETEDPNELGAKLIKAELMGDDELVEKLKKRLEAARAKAAEPPEDPNELGAKLIKAELMGDDELVESLKKRLEAARARQTKSGDSNRKKNEDNIATTSKKPHHHHHHHHHGHQNAQHQKHHHKKNRGKEDKQESQAFFKSLSDYEDEEAFESLKSKKFKGADSEQGKKELNYTPDNCQHCLENIQKHLIVSIGKYSYLCVPSTHSLVVGHCQICPINHVSSSVLCDEEVWSEIQDFRKALVKMFDARRLDCVFYEQYSTEKKHSHLVIECIPLGMSVSNLAPIYFKKALLESESEWAQNRSIIDLKKQNLRKTIPKHMPYFNVNFGLEDGYAHIIENNESFPDHFAKEILGGILDLDPMEWRRPPKESFGTQSSKVIEFLKWWKDYDFNKK